MIRFFNVNRQDIQRPSQYISRFSMSKPRGNSVSTIRNVNGIHRKNSAPTITKKKKINHRKPSTSIRKGNISRQWSGDTHYLLFSTKAPTAIEPLPVPPTLARTQRLVPCLPCMVENTHGNVEHRNDQKRQSKTIRNGANFNVNHKTLSTSTVTKINANHLKINVKH